MPRPVSYLSYQTHVFSVWNIAFLDCGNHIVGGISQHPWSVSGSIYSPKPTKTNQNHVRRRYRDFSPKQPMVMGHNSRSVNRHPDKVSLGLRAITNILKKTLKQTKKMITIFFYYLSKIHKALKCSKTKNLCFFKHQQKKNKQLPVRGQAAPASRPPLTAVPRHAGVVESKVTPPPRPPKDLWRPLTREGWKKCTVFHIFSYPHTPHKYSRIVDVYVQK